MSTRNITNTVLTSGGAPIVGARIRVYLMPGPGFKKDTFAEVAPNDETVTDSNGTWTFTLESNENISPDGTYYYVTEEIPDFYGGSREWSFRVLNSTAATAQLSACLIVPPPNLPTPPTYLTQALGDARYAQLGGAQAIWAAGGSFPANAFVPNVVVGGQLQAAWANAIRDRSTMVFPDAATRDSTWTSPPNGALCVTLDTNTIWQRVSGVWYPLPRHMYYTSLTSTVTGSNITPNNGVDLFGTINVNMVAGCVYQIEERCTWWGTAGGTNGAATIGELTLTVDGVQRDAQVFYLLSVQVDIPLRIVYTYQATVTKSTPITGRLNNPWWGNNGIQLHQGAASPTLLSVNCLGRMGP